MRPSTRVLAALLVSTSLVVAACTGPEDSAEEGVSASAMTPAESQAVPSPGPSASPDVPGLSTSPAPTAPLALVVHRSRPARDVPLRTARALVAGDIDDWAQLDQDPGELRVLAGPTAPGPGASLSSDAAVVAAVAADPDLLGLVPAGAATPLVRVLPVGGRNPLRDPDSYRLTTPGSQPAEWSP